MLKKPLFEMVTPVLRLPRIVKRALVLVIDVCSLAFSVWFAYFLRLGEFISFSGDSEWATGFFWSLSVSILVGISLFIAFGLYRAIFRYSGWPALMTVAQCVGIYGLIYVLVFTVVGISGVPRTIGIIQPILLLLIVGASRAFARIWLGDRYRSILKHSSRPRALVYGAGSAGRQLVSAMSGSYEMQIVGFLDDDDRLHGHVLNGQSIYDPGDLNDLVVTLNITNVFLAMPSLSRGRRIEILKGIRSARVAVRTLPSVSDWAVGKVTISDLQELDIDDLLGREPVMPNHILLTMNVSKKVVMVTGAGGSIGSEICRQIINLEPSKLLLIELSEFALYAIHQELENSLGGNVELVPLLASVQDQVRLREIISTWNPDTVYHAAAYKHVPLVEHNAAEGLKNNVFGTIRTALVSAESGVSDFVLVSTDKAVRPTNVMGASKRLAEMALQAIAANNPDTKFSMVRFGNVLGSSGSVVPKFRRQIRDGGAITLTHPEITRFFMTTSEAAQLVIQAGAMANSGDVFVLDMGKPVKIRDLAVRMIELSGLTLKDDENPEGDIEIEIIGLRPGEKLYEELLLGDNPKATAHNRIMKAQDEYIVWSELEKQLNTLEIALQANDLRVIRLMMETLVPGYVPENRIVDWVHVKQEMDAVEQSRKE